MKKKSDVDFSPISVLPDELVLAILNNKVIDLKTLCLCEAVSKRFYAIVHRIDTVRVVRSGRYSLYTCDKDWLKSISMFKSVNSVSIYISDCKDFNFDGYLCKWKVKMGLNGIDSFVIFFPTSIYDNKGLLVCEEKKEKYLDMFFHALNCLLDAIRRVVMSWRITGLDMPLLEKVTFTDSDNRGRVSVNGRERIDELKKWKSIGSFVPRVRECYLPSLELPVSGYVMKGVSLVLIENRELPDDGNYDRFIDDYEIDFKHDKEEAVYYEAMMEIFKIYKRSIVRRPPDESWIAIIYSYLQWTLKNLPQN